MDKEQNLQNYIFYVALSILLYVYFVYLQLLNKAGKFVHFITKKNRFLAAAALKFGSAQVCRI